MSHWTIEIDYTTGNSFGSEDIYGEEVGYCWERKEDALTALSAIKEHHELYDLKNDYRYRWRPEYKDDRDKRVDELKKRPWYDDSTYSIKVPDNEGGTTVISPFWCGYFERLIEARVEARDPDLNEMVFRP